MVEVQGVDGIVLWPIRRITNIDEIPSDDAWVLVIFVVYPPGVVGETTWGRRTWSIVGICTYARARRDRDGHFQKVLQNLNAVMLGQQLLSVIGRCRSREGGCEWSYPVIQVSGV